jgi:hypothetical protein
MFQYKSVALSRQRNSRMKKCILALWAFVLLSGGQVKADLVYDNGPIAANLGYQISGGEAISDSFTVSSTTNLTGATAGFWVVTPAVPISVQWSIGTTALGSDVSSGIATITSNTFRHTNGIYSIYESAFALSGAVAAGQTYWLTLQNSTPVPMFWDVNGGPSSATFSQSGGGPLGSIASESFQLFDSVAAVPEPSTLNVAAVIGALSLIARGWKRRKSPSA